MDSTKVNMSETFLDPKLGKIRGNFQGEKMFRLKRSEVMLVKFGRLDVFFYRRSGNRRGDKSTNSLGHEVETGLEKAL